MESVWRNDENSYKREKLTKDIKADVAVIGAGMAGVLTAYQLKKRGIEAVVLEADRVGSGETGNTTAKITSQHGVIYHRLRENWGIDRARQYASCNEWAISEYKRIVKDEQLDCMLQSLSEQRSFRFL